MSFKIARTLETEYRRKGKFLPITDQGPVVRRLISANPRLNFNLDFFIPLFKCFVGIVFLVLYRASNNHILDKKNSTEFFLLKLSDLKSDFTLTLGYLNLALNNPAQYYTFFDQLGNISIPMPKSTFSDRFSVVEI